MAGLQLGVPITTNADFKSMLGIEGITNLMSDGDLSGIHITANDDLYRKLVARLNPAKILNPTLAKKYVITAAAVILFKGKALEKGGDTLWDKVSAYQAELESLWPETLAALEADLDNDGVADRRIANSLPIVFNQDDDAAREPYRTDTWPWA